LDSGIGGIDTIIHYHSVQLQYRKQLLSIWVTEWEYLIAVPWRIGCFHKQITQELPSVRRFIASKFAFCSRPSPKKTAGDIVFLLF
jgi:hypothetical protein